jgi:hypothetical protein
MEKKRYNLVMPLTLYEQIERAAKKYEVKIVSMIIKLIRIGLLAEQSDAIILRKDGEEKEIILM